MPTLQERMDQSATDHKSIYLDEGYEALTDTALMARQSGGKVIGEGRHEAVAGGHEVMPGSSIAGGHTTIYWDSEDDKKPMISTGGSTYKTFSEFALIGNAPGTVKDYRGKLHWDKYANNIETGVLVSREPKGLGSGKHVFEKLFFANMKEGIRFGEDGSQANCDVTSIRDVTFRNVENCIHLEHSNSQGYSLNHTSAHFKDGGYFLHVQGGGSLNSTGAFFSHGCTVVYIDGPESEIGILTDVITFNQIESDAQSGHEFKLLDSNPDTVSKGYLNMEVNRGTIGGTRYEQANARLATIYGRQQLTLVNVQPLQRGMFNWHTQSLGDNIGHLTLDRCVVMPDIINVLDLLEPTDSTNRLWFTARDCKDYYGNPLPNFGPSMVCAH